MYDLLFRWTSEAAAKTDVATWPQGLLVEGQWDTSRCTPVQVWRGETPVPGFRLWVGLAEYDEDLAGKDACMLAARRSERTIRRLGKLLTRAQLAGLRIEPVMAGSSYDFSAPVFEEDAA